MTRKIIFATFMVLASILALPTSVSAKKLLPRAKSATTTRAATGGGVATGGPTVKVKMRGDRQAIVATFSNLASATSVSYMLSYNTRGTTQGASGSVNVSENNTTREIIFGTCSHGVCRYDYGLSGAKFVVTIKLPNGKKIVKTFRLKI